jgi:hypothetical protein
MPHPLQTSARTRALQDCHPSPSPSQLASHPSPSRSQQVCHLSLSLKASPSPPAASASLLHQHRLSPSAPILRYPSQYPQSQLVASLSQRHSAPTHTSPSPEHSASQPAALASLLHQPRLSQSALILPFPSLEHSASQPALTPSIHTPSPEHSASPLAALFHPHIHLSPSALILHSRSLRHLSQLVLSRSATTRTILSLGRSASRLLASRSPIRFLLRLLLKQGPKSHFFGRGWR